MSKLAPSICLAVRKLLTYFQHIGACRFWNGL